MHIPHVLLSVYYIIYYKITSLFQTKLKLPAGCEQFHMIHFWSWLSLNVTVGLNNIDRDTDFSFINLLFSFEVDQKLGENVI